MELRNTKQSKGRNMKGMYVHNRGMENIVILKDLVFGIKEYE